MDTNHVNIIKNIVNIMNGKKEYCLRTILIRGNVNPTKKFPDQLETLIAAIIIGLGPTSVNSEKNKYINVFMNKKEVVFSV